MYLWINYCLIIGLYSFLPELNFIIELPLLIFLCDGAKKVLLGRELNYIENKYTVFVLIHILNICLNNI